MKTFVVAAEARATWITAVQAALGAAAGALRGERDERPSIGERIASRVKPEHSAARSS